MRKLASALRDFDARGQAAMARAGERFPRIDAIAMKLSYVALILGPLAMQ